jgi:hypothetical protein
METKNEIMVKPYTAKELGKLYGVSRRTIYLWLQPLKGEIGIAKGRYFNIRQVTMLFKSWGLPFQLEN